MCACAWRECVASLYLIKIKKSIAAGTIAHIHAKGGAAATDVASLHGRLPSSLLINVHSAMQFHP